MTLPAATSRAPRRRWLRRLLVVAVLLGGYPAFVLGSVYLATSRSDLPGGRHGPKDAYRHTLASATVAFTGSPRWVDWVTAVMEGDAHRHTGRSDAARAMDAHNNRIGARIGAGAESWNEMNAAVLQAVQAGGVAVEDEDRITWLSSERWQDRWY
ncbi:DUF6973 domain-containing protein [Lysobacter brunescens]|uniref:DUF6973 domain-containing protein n=1 Tax=Lysobacter brunescens TaxID=262323 RepID=A0ABW2YGV5_9GAMM